MILREGLVGAMLVSPMSAPTRFLSRRSSGLAAFSLLLATGCGPWPWVRHEAILKFVGSEKSPDGVAAFLSTDAEGTTVERPTGERMVLADAQKICEEFECDWWEYKDEKRELSVMRIRGRERMRWVGYHMTFEKDPSGWVAKATFLGGERK
jgi:hypothetical protein